MMFNYLLFGLFGISTCLFADTDAREAIVGGTLANKYQFPYQVSVQYPGQGHDCGGGIIGDDLILTAASCVIGSNGEPLNKAISIIAGITDLRQITYPPAVTRKVRKIYVSSEFTPRYVSSTGDIAILRLRDTLELWQHQHLSRLLMPSFKHDFFQHTTAMIAGFGWSRIKEEGSKIFGSREDTRLRYAEADILTHAECQQQHPTISITPSHVCARVKQQDNNRHGVCIGDGGGPLVRDNVVIGVLAIGQRDCAEKNTSAIYTRISHYLYSIRLAQDNDMSSNKLRGYTLFQ